MNRFDAILFDLGNTLIYFDGDWQEVITRAEHQLYQSLLESGLALEPSFLDAYHQRLLFYYQERDTEFIEYTMLYMLRSLLDEKGFTDVLEEVLRRALAEFHEITQAHWTPVEDVSSTLQILRSHGYRLGLVSNAADDEDVQVLVDKAHIRPFFEVILTSAAEGVRKPSPKIFQTALRALGVAPSRAIMVGDTLEADILGAQNAGIFSVWITKWADTPANRAYAHVVAPDAKVSTVNELLPILNDLEEEFGAIERV